MNLWPNEVLMNSLLHLIQLGWALIRKCMRTKCYPVLSQYKDEFKSMKKQGTSLKKAKRLNPVPKRADLAHYRNLKIGFELMCLTPEETISTVLNAYVWLLEYQSSDWRDKEKSSKTQVKNRSSRLPKLRLKKSDCQMQQLCRVVVIKPLANGGDILLQRRSSMYDIRMNVMA